jgi:hypothetical protein
MTDDQRYMLLQHAIYQISKKPMKVGTTVGDWINSLNNDSDNVLKAIKGDSELMKMQISATHQMDSHASGYTAILVEPNTKKAIVVCRGSSTAKDWGDNVRLAKDGDGSDGVSSRQQESVLRFYKDWRKNQGKEYNDIVAIGHSKGGNNATYLTIMDDSIRKSFTVNAPGFSDKFFEKYRDRIEKNGLKVYNNNTENDIVGTIMNQIGHKKYYTQLAHNNGFIDTHLATAIMDFDNLKPGEPFKMYETKQSEKAKQFDRFFNSLIRDTKQPVRNILLEAIANVADSFNIDNLGDISKIALMMSHFTITLAVGTAVAAYFCDYIGTYAAGHPGFWDTFEWYLGKSKYSSEDIEKGIKRMKILCNAASKVENENMSAKESDPRTNILRNALLKAENERLSAKEKDLQVNYRTTGIDSSSLSVKSVLLNMDLLNSGMGDLKNIKSSLSGLSSKISFTAFNNDQRFNRKFANKTGDLAGKIQNLSFGINAMSDILSNISQGYSSVEENIKANLNNMKF